MGLRKRALPWSKAVLGSVNSAKMDFAKSTRIRHRKTVRVAHVSAHVFDAPSERGNGIQGDAGTVATFFIAIDVGRLHSGDHSIKTCRSECSNVPCIVSTRNSVGSIVSRKVAGGNQRQKGHQNDTNLCPFAPPAVSANSRELFWNEWRGRRDSNPRPLP